MLTDSGIEKASLSGEARKEKLKQIQSQTSATKIQSIWRGKSVRNSLLPAQMSPLANPIVSEEDDDEGDENEPQPAVELPSPQPDVSFKWPDPFIEDKSFVWPPMTNSSNEIMDWVIGSKTLLIRTCTWNMAAKKFPSVEDMRKSLFPLNKFHLYYIGTQECERSIAQSAINPSKRAWEQCLTEVFGPKYAMIKSVTLQATHLAVFAHRSILDLCKDIVVAKAPTGFGNRLGNKGGIAIQLSVGKTKIVVVNSHLAAHQNAVGQRNADFHEINTQLPKLLFKEYESLNSLTLDYNKGWMYESNRTLATYADVVIYMGDLNYRIRGNRSAISTMISRDMREALLNNEQLTIAKRNGEVFQEFIESPIHFYPTYKFDFNSEVYDTSAKQRIPSWTDRILYVDRHIKCLAYNSDVTLKTSDHRPVYATFLVDFSFDKDYKKETVPIIGVPPSTTATTSINTNVSSMASSNQPNKPDDSDDETDQNSKVCTIM